MFLYRIQSFLQYQAKHSYLILCCLLCRDIFTVHLLADSGPAAAMSKQAAEPAIYECPLQHVRCDMQQFSALSSCGHIFSDRALKQAGPRDWLQSLSSIACAQLLTYLRLISSQTELCAC